MAFTPSDLTLNIAKDTHGFVAITNKPNDKYIVNISKVLTPIMMKVKPYKQINKQHSLDGVILTEDHYKYIYKQGPYVVPSVFSVYDFTIDANAGKTIAKRAELAHEAKRSNRALYDAAYTGCVNFVMFVVNETWYRELEDAGTFYTNVSAQKLLEHLENHCTRIHDIDAVDIPSVMQTFGPRPTVYHST